MSNAAARVPLHRNRRVLVPLYFFCGGLSGGLLAIAALAQLGHVPGAGGVIALGYRSAFPLIAFGSVLLLLDLTKPLRFVRLMTHFNPTSPVSWGSFGLVVHGGIALLAMLVHLPAPVAAIGLCAALFIASYTGILLTVSARPTWNATPLMGGIFLASALASAVAALELADTQPRWLARFGALALGVQALLLAWHLRGQLARLVSPPLRAAFLASLVLQFVAPLAIGSLPRLAAASVLLGGLAFRYAIFLAEE